MYIRGGYNVYPAEIEEAISKYPAVLLCAVVAAPDPVLGGVGKAFVVPRPGTSFDAGRLNAFLSERLARYKIPSHYAVRDKLPMTPLGRNCLVSATGRASSWPASWCVPTRRGGRHS